MRIDGLGTPQTPDPKSKNTREVDQSKTADKAKVESKQTGDSIELSRDSRNVSDAGYSSLVSKKEQAEAESNAEVSEYRQKTADGFYDKYETIAETSDNLINSADLKDVVEEYHIASSVKQYSSQASEIRYDKIVEVKQKIADGYYDNPTSYGDIADKIINYFGI